MDGFVKMLAEVAKRSGVPEASIFRNRRVLDVSGYFRPTKEWDFLVVDNSRLLAAIELKSQVGPSFGNNFNNRTEEAMGSALDLWTAFREGNYQTTPRPWVGYLFLLEDCPGSTRPVSVREPHFRVREEFQNSSYSERYELFCRKLVLERHYDSAVFMMSPQSGKAHSEYSEPAEDLRMCQFLNSFSSHIEGCVS